MDKINPAEHGQKMYGIMIAQGATHEQALFRSLCIACDEQRGRCAEAAERASAKAEAEAKAKPHCADIFEHIAEGARKAAEEIREHMMPSNLCSDGILR
jgi:hypothetical protein